MSCKVYVGNLAWATDDQALGAHFASVGTVNDAVVMRAEGRSRGFGFVTFSSVEEAGQAIATMNDTELVRVNGQDWSQNNGAGYMPYQPGFAGHPGGAPYQQAPPHFGGPYGQPGFAGYPQGPGYNSNVSPGAGGGPVQSGGYYHPSASGQNYAYPPTGYNNPQQQQPF